MQHVGHSLTKWIRTDAVWQKIDSITDSSTALLKASTRVTACANLSFGHYQWNIAPQLAVGKKIPPKAIAQEIVSSIQPSPIIEDIQAAPNGMINIRLKRSWIYQQLYKTVENGSVSLDKDEPAFSAYRDKKVLVDYSSPNIAKSMHVGHLRSTILGHSLANFLEFSGSQVERVSHIGDWGTNLGMVISQLLINQETTGKNYDEYTVNELERIYKESKKKFDEDKDFQRMCLQTVVKLQGNSDNLVKEIWETISSITKNENQKIYSRLGIKNLIERGESYYQQFIPNLLEDLKKKSIVSVSEGAEVIFVQGYEVPMILTKSEGGSTYDTTDLAAIWYRIKQQNLDWAIYVVDKGQSEHLHRLFDASTLCGWAAKDSDGKFVPRLNHVEFGLVLGSDGKKFKTRSGDAVPLMDLLDEAVNRCLASMKERGREQNMSTEQMQAIGNVIGHNAVKYADLKQSRIKNYIYSADRLTDLKGNTALYIMYTFARIISILRKLNYYQSSGHFVTQDHLNEMCYRIHSARIPYKPIETPLSEPSELKLAVSLLKFPEVVDGVLGDLQPHHLCDYTYELCGHFNDFHRDCRVTDVDDVFVKHQRASLCASSALILHKSMWLLGMESVPEVV